jgi:hypothetical protein
MGSCKVVSFEACAFLVFLVPMRRMGMQLRMRRIPSPNSLRAAFLDYLGPATQARMGSHAAHGNQRIFPGVQHYLWDMDRVKIGEYAAVCQRCDCAANCRNTKTAVNHEKVKGGKTENRSRAAPMTPMTSHQWSPSPRLRKHPFVKSAPCDLPPCPHFFLGFLVLFFRFFYLLFSDY